MKIRNLELENVGVFENLKVEFPDCPKEKAEIHVITGINGSGKSTILKALACMFDYTSTFGGDACPKETNKFVRYLNTSVSSIRNCKGKIEFKSGKDIKFRGCNSDLFDRNHLHTPTQNIELKKYKISLNPELKKERPEQPFSFAVFAYSGYRFINYKNETTPNFSSESKSIENPLYEALEFIKTPNPAYSIDNWIITSLLKGSYARDKNIPNKAKKFNETLAKLEKAISEIVGYSFEFVLDDDLRYVNVKYKNQKLDFEVIPDGLKSLISWLGDLCMRLEGLDWQKDIPVFDRNIILFLDEIENHLHIKWQRMVLPVIQKLLPNAQIFITTHSPFILNSVDDAWIYKLHLEAGKSDISKAIPSDSSNSYIFEVLRTLELESEYGVETQKELDQFYVFKEKILNKEDYNEKAFFKLIESLTSQSTSLNNEVQIELNKLEPFLNLEPSL